MSPSGSRKCHVIKSATEEFEFYLSVDEARKGQIITSVTRGGPADRAGLKDGDRVLSINGNSVEQKSHNQVVAIIRECIATNEITFVVIEKERDPNVKQKTSSSSDLKPRLCKIKKKNNSFGFFLEAQQGDSSTGHFIKKVTKGGAADGTGLRDGDRVIAVGKTNVEKLKHGDVVDLIKKSGTKVALLVIDEEGYQHFKSKNIPITEKMTKGGSTSSRSSSSSAPKQQSAKQAPSKAAKPSTKTVDHKDKGKVRVVHVFKHPTKGYGFFLRAKKGTPGEFIGDIDNGGPAQHAGLQNDDRVMAVNGKSIEGMAHADVIGLIKSKQAQVILVVMDGAAMKHFEEKDDYPTADDIVKPHSHAVRSVKLVKGESGYGMFLKMEKNCPFHIFADIEKGGVADSAGLKDGEIVIAVEGSGVLSDSHEQCIKKIKDAGSSVELIVGSRATSDFFVTVGVAVGPHLVKEWPTEDELAVPSFGKTSKPKQEQKPEVKEEVAATVQRTVQERDVDLGMKPRLCHIVRASGGFGFFLKDDGGHYLINVEKTGPAFAAGVLDYDRIVEINGENVDNFTHQQVVDKIKGSGAEVKFLVVNKQEDQFFQDKGIPITESLLKTDDGLEDEHRPRVCHLVRKDNSYGFHLMGESKRKGQFIKEIAKDGAGDIGGLREGDRIIEVNGVNVADASHDDIVKEIKKKKDEVTFLVVDKEGDAFYKLKNITIVASLAVAKAVVEERDAERESIGRASASSSVIETEVTVHKEDEVEEGVQDLAEEAIAAAAVVAALANDDDGDDESTHEELEETVSEAVEEIKEVIEENLDDKEEEKLEELVKAAMSTEVIEEVVEKIQEDRQEIEEEEEVVDESPVKVEDESPASEDEVPTIEDDAEEKTDEEEGLGAAEKAAITVAAVAVAHEVLENGDDEKSESNYSRSHSPEPEETPSFQEESTDVHDIIQNHVEEKKEEEEDDEVKMAAKAQAMLIQHQIAERFSEKDADSDKEEEPVRSPSPEIRPPSPVQQPPTPPPVKEPESHRPTIVIVPKPVKKIEEPKANDKPAVPLAVLLTESGELPILKPTPQPENQAKVLWGRGNLKPVTRQISGGVATPVAKKEVEEKKESGPKMMSTVAALRAAIEMRNRENQQSAHTDDVKSELAELSKQRSLQQHAEKFGGSVAKKPQENGTTKKKNPWVGEGMSIKIIET